MADLSVRGAVERSPELARFPAVSGGLAGGVPWRLRGFAVRFNMAVT